MRYFTGHVMSCNVMVIVINSSPTADQTGGRRYSFLNRTINTSYISSLCVGASVNTNWLSVVFAGNDVLLRCRSRVDWPAYAKKHA